MFTNCKKKSFEPKTVQPSTRKVGHKLKMHFMGKRHTVFGGHRSSEQNTRGIMTISYNTEEVMSVFVC